MIRTRSRLPPPGNFFETEEILFTRVANAGRRRPAPCSDVAALLDLFEDAKTFGSLIQVPAALAARLPAIEQRCRSVAGEVAMVSQPRLRRALLRVIRAGTLLARPVRLRSGQPAVYGRKYYNARLKAFVDRHIQGRKADLYACFILRNAVFAKANGFMG